MSFDEIRQELGKIESEVFVYSLKKDLSIEQLALLYSNLIGLRNSFLEINYKNFEIDEVEQLRVNLMEGIHMIQILIKEKVGQDTIENVKKLKHLYENNEKVGGNNGE